MNQGLIKEVEASVAAICACPGRSVTEEVGKILTRHPEYVGLRCEIIKSICQRLMNIGTERCMDLANKAWWRVFTQGGDR
jgi:hypothetical protein